MHTLISGNVAIGDFFSNVLPLAYGLKEQGEKVSVLIWKRPEVAKLASEIPLFEQVVNISNIIDDIDLAEFTKQFDRIISDPVQRSKEKINEAWPRHFGLEVVESDWSYNNYLLHRSDRILRVYGMHLKKNYLKINLGWFQNYYKDYKCGPNSILIHCDSDTFTRSYLAAGKLKTYFDKAGYDVRTIDTKCDIRENLFLVDQCRHILTVDTSVLWMAKFLGKKPLCFQQFESSITLGLPLKDCFTSECLNLELPETIFNWAHNHLEHRV